jgi:hypothetical protein
MRAIARRLLLWRGGAAPAFDYYIDSVAGSDSNAGTSEAQAWATIGKLTTAAVLASGVKIGLKCGSVFREMLDALAYTGGTLGAYGTGAKPIIDASDVVSSWSKTGGFTNIYETTWTPTFTGGECPMVFVNGALLLRVASQATCDSTPGSCYASTTYTNGVPAPFYIHSTGSTVPGSDGKTYHKTVRRTGVFTGDGWTVRGIRFRRAQSKDGGLNAGKGMLIEDCIFEDGNVHNMLWAGGIMRRCSAWKADQRISVFIGTGGRMFTHYTGEGTARDVLYEDCDAIMQDAVKAIGVGSGGQGGFYGHGQSGTPFGSVIYRRCRVAYCDLAFDGTQSTSALVENSLAYECGIGHGLDAASGTRVIDGLEYVRATAGGYTYNFFNRFETAAANNLTIRNSIIVTRDSGVRLYYGGSGFVFDNNIVYFYGGAANTTGVIIGINAAGSAIAATMRNNIFQGWSSGSTNYNIQSVKTGSSLTNSDNVYSTFGGNAAYGKFSLNGTTYNDATLWLAAVQPGNETGSSEESANQFSGDPTARVYTLAPGSASATKGIGPQGWTPLAFDYAARCAELVAA